MHRRIATGESFASEVRYKQTWRLRFALGHHRVYKSTWQRLLLGMLKVTSGPVLARSQTSDTDRQSGPVQYFARFMFSLKLELTHWKPQNPLRWIAWITQNSRKITRTSQLIISLEAFVQKTSDECFSSKTLHFLWLVPLLILDFADWPDRSDAVSRTRTSNPVREVGPRTFWTGLLRFGPLAFLLITFPKVAALTLGSGMTSSSALFPSETPRFSSMRLMVPDICKRVVETTVKENRLKIVLLSLSCTRRRPVSQYLKLVPEIHTRRLRKRRKGKTKQSTKPTQPHQEGYLLSPSFDKLSENHGRNSV